MKNVGQRLEVKKRVIRCSKVWRSGAGRARFTVLLPIVNHLLDGLRCFILSFNVPNAFDFGLWMNNIDPLGVTTDGETYTKPNRS